MCSAARGAIQKIQKKSIKIKIVYNSCWIPLAFFRFDRVFGDFEYFKDFSGFHAFWRDLVDISSSGFVNLFSRLLLNLWEFSPFLAC